MHTHQNTLVSLQLQLEALLEIPCILFVVLKIQETPISRLGLEKPVRSAHLILVSLQSQISTSMTKPNSIKTEIKMKY